jgi:hypothetical protein
VRAPTVDARTWLFGGGRLGTVELEWIALDRVAQLDLTIGVK